MVWFSVTPFVTDSVSCQQQAKYGQCKGQLNIPCVCYFAENRNFLLVLKSHEKKQEKHRFHAKDKCSNDFFKKHQCHRKPKNKVSYQKNLLLQKWKQAKWDSTSGNLLLVFACYCTFTPGMGEMLRIYFLYAKIIWLAVWTTHIALIRWCG